MSRVKASWRQQQWAAQIAAATEAAAAEAAVVEAAMEAPRDEVLAVQIEPLAAESSPPALSLVQLSPAVVVPGPVQLPPAVVVPGPGSTKEEHVAWLTTFSQFSGAARILLSRGSDEVAGIVRNHLAELESLVSLEVSSPPPVVELVLADLDDEGDLLLEGDDDLFDEGDFDDSTAGDDLDGDGEPDEIVCESCGWAGYVHQVVDDESRGLVCPECDASWAAEEPVLDQALVGSLLRSAPDLDSSSPTKGDLIAWLMKLPQHEGQVSALKKNKRNDLVDLVESEINELLSFPSADSGLGDATGE